MSEPPWWPSGAPDAQGSRPAGTPADVTWSQRESHPTPFRTDAQVTDELAARLGTLPARRRRSSAPVAVVLVLGLAAIWLSSRIGTAVAARNAPPPGLEESAVPLGTPPLGAPTTGPYTFLQTQTDGVTPVTYDPCRPIHYVVRADGAPAGGDALLARGLSGISVATGLQFVG